jgi:hypothetical protein
MSEKLRRQIRVIQQTVVNNYGSIQTQPPLDLTLLSKEDLATVFRAEEILTALEAKTKGVTV